MCLCCWLGVGMCVFFFLLLLGCSYEKKKQITTQWNAGEKGTPKNMPFSLSVSVLFLNFGLMFFSYSGWTQCLTKWSYSLVFCCFFQATECVPISGFPSIFMYECAFFCCCCFFVYFCFGFVHHEIGLHCIFAGNYLGPFGFDWNQYM